MGDVDEQHNYPVQSQVPSDPTFADRIRLREEAAKAFIEEHAKAKDACRRAVAGRNRPLRGPYHVGQLVYMFSMAEAASRPHMVFGMAQAEL